ncbi:TetR/AcrR family transcriptional regulator [Streptomyces sp. NPDC005407]|uniref:TetR/AcrR family transcriptional regulator n=1 Tax=Streptomyces sp. NPDC005407 TaxID=3155340 RepID=UPI00339F020B
MPTARESLLNAALMALAQLPWSGVRMVDVASAAGVSRQTLYNEFGSKDGLARGLVRREADTYLHGVERLLAERTGAADRLVSVAEWTVGEARAKPLLRALLTGCWSERLPVPRPARRGAVLSKAPAQRRADAGLPSPAELVAAVRDRAVAALEKDSEHGRTKEESADLAHRSELAVRLALAYVIAPVGEGIGPLVRAAVGGAVSATSPTAADRRPRQSPA